MKQPSRRDLLHEAATRLKEAREAAQRGNRKKAEALQSEARELLRRRGGRNPKV
jgi:hypothetical protein